MHRSNSVIFSKLNLGVIMKDTHLCWYQVQIQKVKVRKRQY